MEIISILVSVIALISSGFFIAVAFGILKENKK